MENKTVTNKTKAKGISVVNVNLKVDNKSNTLLHRAAAQGSLKEVRYLLENPSRLLVDKNNLEEARYLRENPSYALEAKNKFGSTPLHYATWFGQLEVVKFLVDQHAELSIKDNSGQSLIHAAAWNGHLDLLKYFFEEVDRGDFSLHAKDNEGDTPFLSAARNGNLNVMKFLISYGADINAVNYGGETGLILATKQGDMDIVRYIFAEKADKDDHGNTLLHLAVINGHLELSKYLVSLGLDINAKNGDENMPLHLAVENEKPSLAEFLIAAGADVNAKNGDGSTPLHLAVIGENEDDYWRLILSMIKQNADVKAKNSNGDTPLHLAVEKGRIYLGLYFIGKGADVNAKNTEGKTPVEIAIENNDEDYIKEFDTLKAKLDSQSNNVQEPNHDLLAIKEHIKEHYESLAPFLNENATAIGFFKNNGVGAYANLSANSMGVNNSLTNYQLGFIP